MLLQVQSYSELEGAMDGSSAIEMVAEVLLLKGTIVIDRPLRLVGCSSCKSKTRVQCATGVVAAFDIR